MPPTRRVAYAPRLVIMAKSPARAPSSGGSRARSAPSRRRGSTGPRSRHTLQRLGARSALADLSGGRRPIARCATPFWPRVTRASARRWRSRCAHAAPVRAPAARARCHRRQRHSRLSAQRISPRPSGCLGRADAVFGPARGRRLLAGRVPAKPRAARALCRRALVEPTMRLPTHRQSRRQNGRVRRTR